MSGKLNEAPLWALFSGGGVAAALFLPGLIMTTGLVLPTRDPAAAGERYAQLHRLLAEGWWQWPLRALLLGVMGLAFFHAAHRIRHTLMDVGLRGASAALSFLAYGGALAGVLITAAVLLKF